MTQHIGKTRSMVASAAYALAIVASIAGPGLFVMLNIPNVAFHFAIESFSTLLLVPSFPIALSATLAAIVLDYRWKLVLVVASMWGVAAIFLVIVPVRFSL